MNALEDDKLTQDDGPLAYPGDYDHEDNLEDILAQYDLANAHGMSRAIHKLAEGEEEPAIQRTLIELDSASSRNRTTPGQIRCLMAMLLRRDDWLRQQRRQIEDLQSTLTSTERDTAGTDRTDAGKVVSARHARTTRKHKARISELEDQLEKMTAEVQALRLERDELSLAHSELSRQAQGQGAGEKSNAIFKQLVAAIREDCMSALIGRLNGFVAGEDARTVPNEKDSTT